MKSGAKFFAFLIVFVARVARTVSEAGGTDEFYPGERNDLIRLRDSLGSTVNLHSNWTGPPCFDNRSQWIGITCSNSHVVGVLLEQIQLTGSLPPTAFQNITYLTELDLRSNALHGPIPDLKGLSHLRVVLLSHNRFSGPIPAEFVDLPILTVLELQDNLVNGTVPPFDQQSLTVFNVSYNFLERPIPETSTLQRFPNSSYDHNLELCGKPLEKPCPTAPPPTPTSGPPPPSRLPPPLPSPPQPSPPNPPEESRKKGVGVLSVVLIAVGATLVPIALVLGFLCYYKRRRAKGKNLKDGSGRGAAAATETDIKERPSWSIGDSERIVELEFFHKERPVFDLDDLLRSSAQVLGKGQLGTTFKAVLAESGPVVIVKRLKEMSWLPKKEFVQQMQLLGKMRHENLVEIISFYYSKDEKLVISEYVPGRSLFELLHDNRGEGRAPLNWAARLCIVKGVARGLAYLHQSLPSHKVPHADLKSSNVIILRDADPDDDRHFHPKLTDFGLLPLLPCTSSTRKLAVVKSPEFSQGKKLTHKADVYCFGLLILEVITGRVPSDNGGDLSEWVSSVVNIDWSTDMLDLEILAEKDGHGEMLKLTGIALECTSLEPEIRPRMNELLRRIEEIKEANDEDITSIVRRKKI